MSDSVQVECDHCSSRLNLRSREKLGKRLKCPKCGEGFVARLADAREPEPRREEATSEQKQSTSETADGRSKGVIVWAGVAAGAAIVLAGLWAAGIFSDGEAAVEPGLADTSGAEAKPDLSNPDSSTATPNIVPTPAGTSGAEANPEVSTPDSSLPGTASSTQSENVVTDETERYLAGSYEKQGDERLHTGHVSRALGFYQKSLEIRSKLAAAHPTDSQTQRELWVTYKKLGDVRMRTGPASDALGFYRRAFDISNNLMEVDPTDVQTQLNMSVSYVKLGEATRRMGDAAEVLGYFRRSREIAEKLAMANPDDVQAQRELAVAYLKLGDMSLELDQASEASSFFQRSLEIREKLVVADPTNVQAQRDHSISYERLGDVSQESSREPQALEFFRQSREINLKLASADSTDAQAQRNLSISYGKLGGMRLESGMVAEALEFFRKAMEIDEKLAAIDSADVGAQRDLSYSYYNMGEANLEARDESAAFDFFQQMLEIDKKLAAADPKNAEALRNVAISYDRVAAIELGRGNLSAARTLFEQQLAIVEQRLKLDSRNPDAHEMVYLVCYDLADLSLKMEQMADAIVYFRQAYGARFDYAAIKEKRNQYVQAVESYDGGLEVIDWIKRKNRLQPADEESFATATAAVTRCRKLLAAKPEPDPSLPLPEPDVSKPVAEPDLSKPADVAQEEEFVSGRPYLLKGRSLPTMLEQSVPYTKTEEGITKIGRHYIRTRSGQFLTRDFVYEVRFTLNTNDGIAFIGMGQGGRAGAYKEPGNSVHLRIHSTGRYRGEVGITSADDKSRKLINDKFGKLAEPGTHRVRITKRGNAVTFTLDVDDDGPSDDDMTKSFPDIHKAAPFLHSKNTFLFFGGDGTFSEVRLGKPEPTPEKPQLEPKKPEPASEKPEPEPEKPEPTPQKPKPEEPTLERFTLTGQWPAVLEKTIPFTQTRGGIGKIGRKYIRTKSGQFLDRDFTYEVQFTLKKDGGIAFIGFGAGLPNPSNFEPDDSVYLRLHAVGRYGGEVRIASAEAPNARYGVFRAPGTHRVRIIKSGQKVTFSVDVNDDGPTKDDMTKSFPDIRKVGPYLDSKNGYLFFGGDGTFSEVRLSR